MVGSGRGEGDEMAKVNPVATMEEVAMNVCRVSGHDISVLKRIEATGKWWDRHIRIHRDVMCLKCGMTLKEIRGK